MYQGKELQENSRKPWNIQDSRKIKKIQENSRKSKKSEKTQEYPKNPR